MNEHAGMQYSNTHTYITYLYGFEEQKTSNSPLKDVTTSWFTLGSWGSILNHRGNHTPSLHDAAWLQQPAVEKREWEGEERVRVGG